MKKQGFKIAPFKIGPDFIDAGHHAHIAGRPCRNLDGWMLSKDYNVNIFKQHSYNMDIAVIEGVMGLFDGFDGKSETASTAQIAKWLNLPIVLIVDAKSMARSGAALIQGFENFDPDLNFAGVIFNNIGSLNHLKYLEDALENHIKMQSFGGILRNPNIAMPERHLGLVTKEDNPLSPQKITALSDIIDKQINIKALLDNLKDNKFSSNKKESPKISCEKKVKIGVARDKAFCFYYLENLEFLQEQGADLSFFSPIEDSCLPDNLDGLYLGGGYPELYAKGLSKNKAMCLEIRKKSKDKMPIYAECGGFIYLCKQLKNSDEKCYLMANCFPFTICMSDKLQALGYREISFKKDIILGKGKTVVRGHEFHYSQIETVNNDIDDIEKTYNATAGRKGKTREEGYLINNTLGSYIHLHFGSNPTVAKAFVQECQEYKKSRMAKNNYSKFE